MAIAVVDERGDIIIFIRTDGNRPESGQFAITKAYTAAMAKRSSKQFLEFLKGQDWAPYFSMPGRTTIAGGVPITEPGKTVVYGGIGVAGFPKAEDDERLAFVGLKALQDFLWPSQ